MLKTSTTSGSNATSNINEKQGPPELELLHRETPSDFFNIKKKKIYILKKKRLSKNIV